MNHIQLIRNSAARLLLSLDGVTFEEVVPTRAFPIAAPAECISLTGVDGHERLWIEKLDELAEDTRLLIIQELAHREFTPKILRINSVSSFATPSTWQLETDRGCAQLLLKAEDHIRRLSPSSLLITDSYGVSFVIDDTDRLDTHSRKLLDRFL